jgi:hypothetical protein
MKRSLHVLTSSALLWMLAAAALADVTPRQAIEAWAFPKGGMPRGMPEPQPVNAPAPAKLFLDYSFYSIIFPQ